MTLPIFNTAIHELSLLQTQWASQLNQLLLNPVLQPVLLKKVQLLAASNPNVINHTLGRKLQGWFVVRGRAYSQVYDTQDSNPNQASTLWLMSSADAVVDLVVF